MKLEVNQGIKVLRINPEDGSLRSCHGGDFQWDPPIPNGDGTYTPGAWTEPVEPELCDSGYHLTDDPIRWWDLTHHHAYLVEFKGKVSGTFGEFRDRKISVESCRLLRPFTATELAGYNIFIEGKHKIKNATSYAHGNSTVYSHGNGWVFAGGNATVIAYDNVIVYASGNAMVYTYGNVIVYASGNTVVDAYGNSKVTVNINATVNAYGLASVFAYGNSNVNAYGKVDPLSLGGHTGTITRL